MVREEKGERKSTKKQSGKKDKIDNNSRIYRWKKGGLCLPKEDGGKNLIRGFLFFSLIQTDATDTNTHTYTFHKHTLCNVPDPPGAVKR